MRVTHNLKPDELNGPDLLSEIVIALGGAIVFFLLMLTLIAALVRFEQLAGANTKNSPAPALRVHHSLYTRMQAGSFA